MNEIIKSNVKYLEETQELCHALAQGFIELGEHLYNIFTKELWRGQYDLYEEFLETLDISPANASKIRQVYEHYILKLGYDREKLGKFYWSNLYKAIPVATSVSKVDKLISQGSRYIDDEIRDVKHPECKHVNTYVLKVCKDCGYRIKVK